MPSGIYLLEGTVFSSPSLSTEGSVYNTSIKISSVNADSSFFKQDNPGIKIGKNNKGTTKKQYRVGKRYRTKIKD